ncbi:MAG TPA: DNRLRE domain-containing protein [Chthoniobacteraceae bacterium]|jgi:hypothetical protein|nr:DNRLRE domain-containing protein [Chthoniobacteraceae bacterium]
MRPFLPLLLALCVACTPSRGAPPAGVPVTITAYAVAGEAQPADPNLAGVLVTAGGRPLVLPPAADISLWKEGKTSSGTDASVTLRDNRWGQGLIKLDLAALNAQEPVESAVFRFKVGGVERPGNAVFKCYRILVDWSEAATWFKPFPDRDPTWNGMKAGVDFEAQPFATFETAELKKGDTIEIPGFEKAIQAWRDGSWQNYGFLITLSGKSLQTGFPSRESAGQAKDLAIGGGSNARVLVKFDPALIARVLEQPEDFLAGTVRLRLANPKQAPAGATVHLLSPRDHRELGSAPAASASAEGWIEIKTPTLRNEPSLLIEASAPLRLYAASVESWRPQLVMAVRDHPKAVLFDHEVKPAAGVFNVVKDGHFSYGGKRLRLWGMVGYGAADRLRKMGFNAQRVWEPSLSRIYEAKDFPAELAKRGELPPVTKGDGSILDEADAHFADLKAHGMFVMFAALTNSFPLKPLLADDSFIAGGADWADWKKAVAAEKTDGDLKRYAVFFDRRLQKVRLKSAEALLNHVNPYTGKRYAEDELIALYEVWNEDGGVNPFLNEGRKLPPFFEREEQAQWSAWLGAKYHDEAGLLQAWGKLATGETLATVKPAPVLAERAAYPEQRARDFTEFLFDAVVKFNNTFRDHCRALAPKGVGVNVVPFSFDTQYRPSLPWLHVNAQGDVNCPGMYFWGLKSSLAAPPSGYVIDSHTVDGLPTVLYETNQARPNPSRAEYPIKLAAMASWQDWDGIFWHYWAAKDLKSDEEYLAGVLPQIVATHYWTGVQHERDPVMTSAMALAGRIFLQHEIKPAPAPSIYHVGRPGLFGFDFINGIGAGRAMFARGSRIKFDPQSEAKLTIENEVSKEPITAAVPSGDEILWDWPQGRLIIDSPSVKAYVGKVVAEPYRFRDGTVLSGLSTPWVCWVLASADGRPLATAKRAFVTAVADATNTDFDFDWTVAGGPLEQAKGVRNRGRAPVIVEKVDYTLSLPAQADYTFSGYDFATRKVMETTVTNTNVVRLKNRELWMGVLDFTRRGPAAAAVVDANPGAPAAAVAGGPGASPESDPKLAAVWNPIPGLHWGDGSARTHQILREARIPSTALSPEEEANGGDRTTLWTDAQLLFASPANIEVAFHEGRMQRIVATFTRPPAIRDVVAAYEKQFGPALEKVFTRQEEQSHAQWTVKQPAATLEIKVTEAQGTQVLTFELKPL